MRLRATFAELEPLWPDDDEELVWAEGAQHRLELEGEAPPKKKASRLAMACGFSLPADTAVHAFDRVGRCLALPHPSLGAASAQRLVLARHDRVASALVCPGCSFFIS